jgi:hypothetical protein
VTGPMLIGFKAGGGGSVVMRGVGA